MVKNKNALYTFLLSKNKNNAKKLNESGDYYSLPKKIDIKKFKKNNGKIINIKDLLWKPKLHV